MYTYNIFSYRAVFVTKTIGGEEKFCAKRENFFKGLFLEKNLSEGRHMTCSQYLRQ